MISNLIPKHIEKKTDKYYIIIYRRFRRLEFRLVPDYFYYHIYLFIHNIIVIGIVIVVYTTVVFWRIYIKNDWLFKKRMRNPTNAIRKI